MNLSSFNLSRSELTAGLLTIVDLVDYTTQRSWLSSKFWSIDF